MNLMIVLIMLMKRKVICWLWNSWSSGLLGLVILVMEWFLMIFWLEFGFVILLLCCVLFIGLIICFVFLFVIVVLVFIECIVWC